MFVPMLVHAYGCLLTTDNCLEGISPHDARLQICSLRAGIMHTASIAAIGF